MAGRVSVARRQAREYRPDTKDSPGQVREPRDHQEREQRDKGASSIELVLLAPLVILCILLIGQFAMWYQARHVAIAAAQAGARTARDTPNGPWAAAAESSAMQLAQQLGGTLLQGENARAVTSGSNRGVRVTAVVPRIIPIPGMTFKVSETSMGPIECFRASGDTQQCAGG